MSEKQIIGIDIGRGAVKYYSKFKEEEIAGKFNAVFGAGRSGINFRQWDDPIALEINGNNLFFGELAIKESISQTSNIKDEKDTFVSEMLFIAALSLKKTTYSPSIIALYNPPLYVISSLFLYVRAFILICDTLSLNFVKSKVYPSSYVTVCGIVYDWPSTNILYMASPYFKDS